jgi:CspA family cold shock protein
MQVRGEDETALPTGRILQFDDTRGFGFIAADDGGEDVFLHRSAFDGDLSGLTPGTRVEFQITADDRGRSAFAVHLIEGDVAADHADDVLSRAEFGREVTELLLEAAPDLTGEQLRQARRGLEEFARKYGWVEA